MSFNLFGVDPDGPTAPNVTKTGQASPDLDNGDHHDTGDATAFDPDRDGVPTGKRAIGVEVGQDAESTGDGEADHPAPELAGDHNDDDGQYLDRLFTANPDGDPLPYGTGPQDHRKAPFAVPHNTSELVHEGHDMIMTGEPGPVELPAINRMLVRTIVVGGDPAQASVGPVLLFPPDPNRKALYLYAKAGDPAWRLAGDNGELAMCGHSMPTGVWLPVIEGYTGPVYIDRDSVGQSTVTTVTVTGITITDIPAAHHAH